MERKNVQALFFLTSQYVKENQALVQRIIDEGHAIGNHSYHHHSFADISMEKNVEEIMLMNDLMITHFQYIR